MKKLFISSFKKQCLLSCIIFIGALLFSYKIYAGKDGEKLFNAHCTSCHTIGKGRLIGPDLKGVTKLRSEQWLMKWIKSSQTLIKSGDTAAVAIFDAYNKAPMPDQDLKEAEIKGIIAYIKSQSGAGDALTSTATAKAKAAPQIAMKSTDKATEKEIILGQNLFEGRMRFKNGGPSCISCHNVNTERIIPGGLLAKDLTNTYSRMGGDAGVAGIINAPPFPAMTQAFKGKPITKNEAFALTAFLNKVDQESKTHTIVATSPLLKYGFGGFIIWVCIILIVWRKKKWNMVKQRIFNRQVKAK